MAGIFSKQTGGTVAYNIPPIAAFVLFWLLIVWLGQIEAGCWYCYDTQHLVQIIFSKITAGNPIESKESPRNAIQNVFFWSRVLMKCAALGYAFAVTLALLFQGKTTMWAGCSPYYVIECCSW
jgi:hypothetical protein